MTAPAGPTPAPRASGRWDPLVLFLLVAGIALRFVALGQQSFWYDEIDSVESTWVRRGHLADTLFNPHGPLYLVLLRGWLWLFGSAEAQVRMLSAILGSLGLVLFHRMTRRLAGPAVATIALALLAVSPYFLWYSQEARNYVLLFDLGLLAVPAFANEVERRTRASFAAAVVTIVATCLANLSGFFLLVLDAVYALTVGRRLRYPPRRFLLLALCSVVLLWPWIHGGARTTGRLHLNVPGTEAPRLMPKGESPPGLLSIPYTLYEFSVGMSLGPSVEALKLRRLAAVIPHLWYLVPLSALFAFVAWRGSRRAPSALRALLLTWLALPILLMAALSVLNLKAPNSRYATLALAPWLILLAIGVDTIRRRSARAAVLAVLVLAAGWADYRYFTDREYWRPDARAAGRLLAREARRGDAVVVYALDYPVRYYAPDSLDFLLPGPGVFADERTSGAWLRANTGGRRRVWIVQCQSWWMDRDDRFLRVCRDSLAFERRWDFTRLPVYRFRAAGGAGTVERP